MDNQGRSPRQQENNEKLAVVSIALFILALTIIFFIKWIESL
jgi:hypothetical protein